MYHQILIKKLLFYPFVVAGSKILNSLEIQSSTYMGIEKGPFFLKKIYSEKVKNLHLRMQESIPIYLSRYFFCHVSSRDDSTRKKIFRGGCTGAVQKSKERRKRADCREGKKKRTPEKGPKITFWDSFSCNYWL